MSFEALNARITLDHLKNSNVMKFEMTCPKILYQHFLIYEMINICEYIEMVTKLNVQLKLYYNKNNIHI